MLPVALAYAVKLRSNNKVLPAIDVYVVVHSVTVVDPFLVVVAETLSNKLVIARYPPETPEDPAVPDVPEEPVEPEVPAEPDVPLEPEDPDVPSFTVTVGVNCVIS